MNVKLTCPVCGVQHEVISDWNKCLLSIQGERETLKSAVRETNKRMYSVMNIISTITRGSIK